MFASGEFQRGTRRLEVHFRGLLGLVAYHVGSVRLSHEDYMWSVLGRRWASQYPGFFSEPLDGFRHLLADLENHAGDFLAGSDDDFAKHAQHVETLKKAVPRLP